MQGLNMFDAMVRIRYGYSIKYKLKFKNDSLPTRTSYNLGKIITAKYDTKTYPIMYLQKWLLDPTRN